MEVEPKFIFTGLILVLDFFLLLPQYMYRHNKAEWDRRYWGKNRTWLKNQLSAMLITAVLITLFLIGIWAEV